MLNSYLKIALRNLWRNKSYSAIQIIGFASGLAVCLLMTLFVTDELSYDKFNTKANRIYRVNANFKINGDILNERLSPAPLGPAMVADYPQIETAARIQEDDNLLLVQKGRENIVEHNSCFADASIFKVFTLPTLAGNPATALSAPNTIVINESNAAKYFPDVAPNDVIGKTLLINNKTNYTVTGVIKDMPAQSHIHFSFLRSMVTNKASSNNNWLDNGYTTYILAHTGTTEKNVNTYLAEATKKYAGPQLKEGLSMTMEELNQKGGYYNFKVIPLTDIHLKSTLARESEPGGSMQYVYIFSITAVLILLIACINFMNLSTARSAGRSKEVGVRKVLGSKRSGLIAQFLTESVVTSVLSAIIAVAIVILLLPYFNRLAGKSFTIQSFSATWLVPGILPFAIVTGLLAGSYLAIFLSSFRPVQVLKGKLSTGFKGSWLRNGLVVFQFTTAIILIVGTLVIYSQLNYIRSMKLGYNRQQVLLLQNTGLLGQRARTFKDAALKIPGVESATMADALPTGNESHADIYFKSADRGPDKSISLEGWFVDADYVPTMQMQVIKGRNFSPKMPTDSAAVLVNETAARLLGYSNNALSKSIFTAGDDDAGKSVEHPIIGVVKDFNAGSLHSKIPPIVFHLSDERGNMAFRIDAKRTASVIAAMENTYHSIDKMAGQPFNYIFMDEDFNKLYASEQRMGNIFTSFAALAILIACMGLFGLVTYAAEQRTKEISIRKVLGAGLGNIVQLLTGDFLKLVVLAAVIAFPVAWWAMHTWLQDFAYRTNISVWVFAIAGVAALGITLATISFRVFKAATANPAESLRSE